MHFNELTVSDFRCFREEQRASLAPLTLLVGENSTGKTSFLALVRALWDANLGNIVPNFKEPPYDLGSFDEIVHQREGREGGATEFEAGFSLGGRGRHPRASRFRVKFRRDGYAPFPSVRKIENQGSGAWAEMTISTSGEVSTSFGTAKGQWKLKNRDRRSPKWGPSGTHWDTEQRQLPLVGYWLRGRLPRSETPEQYVLGLGATTSHPTKEDLKAVLGLQPYFVSRLPRPFSGAPVRFRPHRTYDPSHSFRDAEGEYIPMFLARVARRDAKAWNSLKQRLELFGREAGLFDKIEIKTLGETAGGPFQVRIKKFGDRADGPWRNIVDVGYGVSQALPVVTELLRPEKPDMFLLQQPEVHLHPSAQAALGSLFCDAVSKGRQLIVETHSDHLIDRIRMDVRDGKSKVRHEDVSILYFHRRSLSVEIYCLGWDKNGNLVAKHGDVPDGYRQFFRTERRRSLGL